VRVSSLIRARRETALRDIMRSPLILIYPEMDQEEVAQTFQKYHMASAPVVDEAGRLTGMVTVDDIVDVISEESEEDLLKLAGVSEAAQTDSVFKSVRARAPWLLVNLGTAIVASWVISKFEGSINQLVALAILMPIVASMGGNAGTQALAVAVRAIAARDLTESNAPRYVLREAMTAMSNGLIFALVLAAVVAVWFGSPLLALSIALAVLINFACAGLAGILVPLTLRRFGADPAVSSSVFVTFVTDIVGFMAFLGLATMILLS
jgi:magnesium transporter